MKLNITRKSDLQLLDIIEKVETRQQLDHPKWDIIPMDIYHFRDMVNSIDLRLYDIIPPTNQSGLVFKLVPTLGRRKLPLKDNVRCTWITLYRGSKNWFITGIAIDRPSVTPINPTNIYDWKYKQAIVNHVGTSAWFNS